MMLGADHGVQARGVGRYAVSDPGLVLTVMASTLPSGQQIPASAGHCQFARSGFSVRPVRLRQHVTAGRLAPPTQPAPGQHDEAEDARDEHQASR